MLQLWRAALILTELDLPAALVDIKLNRPLDGRHNAAMEGLLLKDTVLPAPLLLMLEQCANTALDTETLSVRTLLRLH